MRKVYSLLSLCKKAGKLACGEFQAEQAVKGGKAYLILYSSDAGEMTKKKFRNAAVFRGVCCLEAGDKADYGRAVGKEEISVLAVLDQGFAEKLQKLVQETQTV